MKKLLALTPVLAWLLAVSVPPVVLAANPEASGASVPMAEGCSTAVAAAKCHAEVTIILEVGALTCSFRRVVAEVAEDGSVEVFCDYGPCGMHPFGAVE